jgi:hypothetical protein
MVYEDSGLVKLEPSFEKPEVQQPGSQPLNYQPLLSFLDELEMVVLILRKEI